MGLHGKEKSVEYLLKKGADATIAEAQGFTPMHGAAFQGRANIAKILLDHGCPLRGKHEGDGFEPAARSCWGGDRRHTETLKFFLDNGVPVEDIYDECMEKSENQGSISILKRFKKMKEKADEMKTKTEESKAAKTEECKADETGECKAAKTEEPKAAKTFDPNEVDPVYAEAFKELGAAFKDEDFLKAEMVLKKYEGMLDINSQSPRQGQTLLMQSVLHGKEKCVEYLLKRGADVNIAEAKGYTPMHGAAFQGRANIAKMLLDHGCSLRTKHEGDGYEPAVRSCWGSNERHVETLKFFLDNGVPIDGIYDVCMERAKDEAIINTLNEYKAKQSSKRDDVKDEL